MYICGIIIIFAVVHLNFIRSPFQLIFHSLCAFLLQFLFTKHFFYPPSPFHSVQLPLLFVIRVVCIKYIRWIRVWVCAGCQCILVIRIQCELIHCQLVFGELVIVKEDYQCSSRRIYRNVPSKKSGFFLKMF